MDKQSVKKKRQAKQKNALHDLRTILLNAIKMQALYSGGKIKYIETSGLVN
jgi:hypothetical protein